MADQETADLLGRIEALERRQARTDPRASVETVMWAVMRNVFPEETRRHVKAAGREQLLAARSYLDHWIAKLDEAAAEAPATRETIEVE
ncbi:MAG: hypothetical protein M3R32_07345 [Chloroflexota bacterium]|nr:hypothetical protein [Chloroflexota bacterium]